MKLAKLVAKNVSPLHTHDCEDCKFLGKASFPERDLDFYVCSDKTLIVRHGSLGYQNAARDADLWDTIGSGTAFALARELVKRNKIPCAYSV